MYNSNLYGNNSQAVSGLSKLKPQFNQLIKPLALGGMLAFATALTGCGDSQETSSTDAGLIETPIVDSVESDKGTLVLALTDAEEDFVSYTVDVNSIVLTRNNGDQVAVLSEATQVDFVEYQELTELFSVLQVPAGMYHSIEMTLDYSESNIIIQNESGNTYTASAVDESEVALTEHTVTFQLSDGEELEVRKNQLSQLTLDFDLSASNTILSFEPAVVQVEPFIIGEANLDPDREHRVRGSISSVDTVAETVTLNLRPMSKRQGEFGEYTAQLNDQTMIEINGEVQDLASALTYFSSQGDDFPVVMWGSVEVDETTNTAEYTAEQVLAGTSVPWAGKDVFRGLVSDLEEGVTYISGLAIDTDAKQRSYVQDYGFVVSDDTTIVNRAGVELDSSYLVPGQKIQALGDLTESEVNNAFDASAESVRILTSTVLGQVTSIDNNVATIEVKRINKRPVSILKRIQRAKRNLIASNTTTEVETLIVDLSALSQVSVAADDWISVVGYLTPESIIDNEVDMRALLLTKYAMSDTEVTYTGVWGQVGTTATVSEDSTAMTLNLETGIHAMKARFNSENLMPELTELTVVAGVDASSFAIRETGESIVFYDSYSELLNAVEVKLADNETLSYIISKGILNSETNEFEASQVVVKFI